MPSEPKLLSADPNAGRLLSSDPLAGMAAIAPAQSGGAHLATGPQDLTDTPEAAAPPDDRTMLQTVGDWLKQPITKDSLMQALSGAAHPQTVGDLLTLAVPSGVGSVLAGTTGGMRSSGALSAAGRDIVQGATEAAEQGSFLKFIPRMLKGAWQAPAARDAAAATTASLPENAIAGFDRYAPSVSNAANAAAPAAAQIAAAAVHFTAPEVAQGLAWMKQGIPQEQAIQRILSLRQLQASPSFSISSVMGR